MKRPIRIHVQPVGGLANRVFQHMMALVLQKRIPGSYITGDAVPEFESLRCDAGDAELGRVWKIVRHDIDIDEVIAGVIARKSTTILVRAPSLRVEHYEAMKDEIRNAIAIPLTDDVFADDEILVHVRLNKMQQYTGEELSVHRDYPPLPLRFIKTLLEERALRPRFVGEFGDDPLSQALRAAYPKSEFRRNPSAVEDFRYIYSAPRTLLSPSSFSWLASWLSPVSKQVLVPRFGILNPNQRPDVNLVSDEPRYEYFSMPVWRWTASASDVARALSDDYASNEGHFG